MTYVDSTLDEAFLDKIAAEIQHIDKSMEHCDDEILLCNTAKGHLRRRRAHLQGLIDTYPEKEEQRTFLSKIAEEIQHINSRMVHYDDEILLHNTLKRELKLPRTHLQGVLDAYPEKEADDLRMWNCTD